MKTDKAIQAMYFVFQYNRKANINIDFDQNLYLHYVKYLENIIKRKIKKMNLNDLNLEYFYLDFVLMSSKRVTVNCILHNKELNSKTPHKFSYYLIDKDYNRFIFDGNCISSYENYKEVKNDHKYLINGLKKYMHRKK